MIPYIKTNCNINTLKFTVGETYVCDTTYEFLNKAFGANYNGWQRCAGRLTRNAFAWFVRIDGKERNEFTNSWLNKDTIKQRYVGTSGLFDGKPIEFDARNDYRLVFQIYDGDKNRGTKRQYVFKGVFVMDREKSTTTEMIFRKVSECYPMN